METCTEHPSVRLKQSAMIEFLTAERVTADEAWVHHYEPESRHQSMEYHHKRSPAKKKIKTQVLDGKVKATTFWNRHGVIHMDFLDPGTTINSALHGNTQNFETTIKKNSEAQEQHIATT
jgi:hypothetical protein